MKTILILALSVLSLSSFAQSVREDCEIIKIGSTGLSYNIKELSKAIRANNDKQLKVVEIEVRPVDNTRLKDDASQMIKSAALILNSKENLDKDKYKHVVAGAAISYGSREIARLYFKNDLNAEMKSALAGVIVSSVVGVLKEGRDSYGYGNVELKDALATSAGGSLVSFRYNYKF